MDSPAASSSSHSYATRIRQNIQIRPSLRLRQSPDPHAQPLRRPKSAPRPAYPIFPPPGIVLHPDDANSKVFLAIGRSFLSVENRAMTIKDLAEMTVNFGLVCQNVSAASQAITTYIRTHMQRCDIQQDQPLLLRHTLSGTASDDDLLPALHSRSGGAHCTVHPDNRVTNFRRGTMVWYMSRTTGAPCPFARAGIRLCEYGEDGKFNGAVPKEKKKDKDQQEHCGQKRKRPLRGCVAKGHGSDNDEEHPPPKVKLTLRLKPLQSRASSTSTNTNSSDRIIDLSKDSDSQSDDDESEDNDMSVDSSSEDDEAPSPPKPQEEEPWSLPPYPRKSISIPCYTPSTDSHTYFSSPVTYNDPYRRSPSVPYSIGSPPPDSEDEDDDYHITMTGARRNSSDPRSSLDDLDGWDADLDSEGDGEVWESPGPRSPSAPVVLPEVSVKEEPTDVQGMLQAWDDFDHSLAGAKVAEVIAQAAAGALDGDPIGNIKTELLDPWSWESSYSDPHHHWSLGAEGDLTAHIKEEPVDLDNIFLHGTFSPSSPLSPISQLPGLSYSDSPSPESLREYSECSDKQYSTVRPRSKTHPNLPFMSGPSSGSFFSLPMTSHGESTVSSSKPELVIPSVSHSLAALIQSMSMNSPTVAPSSLVIAPTCISPHETRGNPASEVVVVHTCKPCTPAISATQIEGISVYQMMLGPFQLLRRIDTDFVNLSPIVACSGAQWPNLSSIPNAIIVTKGSATVSGTWVPLSVAQAYVRDHFSSPSHQSAPLNTFLSDTLFERFPSALQDFHRSSTQGRMIGHFGPHFGSTLQATQLCGSAAEMQSSQQSQTRSTSPEEHASSHQAFALSLSMSSLGRNTEENVDLPLSATEQEIFRTLCDIPDWDKENSPPSSPMIEEQKTSLASATVAMPGVIYMDILPSLPLPQPGHGAIPMESDLPPDPPLRRSKRVADAMAAQTQQTRTRAARKGGSRNSLS